MQKPFEVFQNFFSTLLHPSNWLIGDIGNIILIFKQLAYEHANVTYQAALTSFRNKGEISDYIWNCSGILTLYTQCVVMAAALQGRKGKDVLS